MTAIEQIRKNIPKTGSAEVYVKQTVQGQTAKSGFSVSQTGFPAQMNQTIRSVESKASSAKQEDTSQKEEQFEGGEEASSAPAQEGKLLTVPDIESRIQANMNKQIQEVKNDATSIIREIKSAIKISLDSIQEGVKTHNQ